MDNWQFWLLCILFGFFFLGMVLEAVIDIVCTLFGIKTAPYRSRMDEHREG